MSARAPRERLLGIVVSILLLLAIGAAATRVPATAPRREPPLAASQPSAVITVAPPPLRTADPMTPVAADTPKPDAPQPELEPTRRRVQTAAPLRSVPSVQPAQRARDTEPSSASVEPSSDPCQSPPASLRSVQLSYGTASATVSDTGISTLNRVARHLATCPSNLLEIRAYANESTGKAENLMLSRQRANAVVGHLNQAGIASHRLIATYRGDRPPGGNRALLHIHPGTNP